MLAEACLMGGQRDRTFAVLETGLRDLGARDPGLALELRAMGTTALATLDLGWPAVDDAEHERLAELVGRGSRTGRQLQMTLAVVGIWTGRRSAPETAARVEAALEESTVTVVDPGALQRVVQGLFALIFADRPERAIELADGMRAHAATHGMAMKLAMSYHVLGLAELRRGELADAEADARASLEIVIENQARFAEPLTRATLGETLIERGRLDEAAEVLGRIPRDLDGLSMSFFTRAAIVRLHRASGARDAAIAELLALGEQERRHSLNNPGYLLWRSQLAHLLVAEDPERARELAVGELADARRLELPSAIGVALRARAACEHGSDQEATLRESVATLESGTARLELTRALIDLGGHLRRAGRRSDARVPLRRALELANRCAAEPLIALAGTSCALPMADPAAPGSPARPRSPPASCASPGSPPAAVPTSRSHRRYS
jgi:tetratricopeptide (TPR) repeat protein